MPEAMSTDSEMLNPNAKAAMFEFRDIVSIPRTIGQKAENLAQLRSLIAEVSEACIFHHTYGYFAKGHILEYTNDFAQWAGKGLEERTLAEHFSSVDPYAFSSVDDLRQELLQVIDRYLAEFPTPREVLPGNEFYFNEAITFVIPARLRAQNLAEFLMALKYVDMSSIYYHFYEARVRLAGSRQDDFSKWIDEVIGASEIAARIRAIDPFMHNLERIRELVSTIIEEELRKEMEDLG